MSVLSAIKRVLKPEPMRSGREMICSVVNQTPWECQLFDFKGGRRHQTDYFNCGYVERQDGNWLVARRAQFSEKHQLGLNDVMAFRVNHDPEPRLIDGQKVDLQQRYDAEHFEDPRVMLHEGKTYVSCCNFIRHKGGMCYPHQIICEVNSQWQTVKRYDPVYGHNGNDTANNKLHEKNWLWFWYHGSPHMVYAASPHTVARFDKGFRFDMEFKAEWPAGTLWHYGQIRGGTPPVLMRDEWWTFFHSSIPWGGSKMRQYHMGAYAFENREPFRVTKITPNPILTGSMFDRFEPVKPPCIFPCGAVIRGPEWFVTFGMNDLECGWIKIPLQQLEERMVAV